MKKLPTSPQATFESQGSDTVDKWHLAFCPMRTANSERIEFRGMTTATSWLSLLLLAGPFLLFTLKILFNLYLIRRHLDSMISALPNSRYIYIWGTTIRKQGWFGGMFLINKIAGMIMFPKSYIRLGNFDRDDASNFPPHLKRLLKIEITLLILSATWMFVISY